MTQSISRRRVVGGSAVLVGTLLLGGCQTASNSEEIAGARSLSKSNFAKDYGARPNEKYPIAALNSKILPPRLRRQQVRYKTDERPGTIIVDTSQYHLYLIEQGGTAMRYGVGLGRQGFEWSGRARVAWKRPWPTWTPPDEMIARQPHLEKYSVRNGGMKPGLKNPLGARALYIFQGEVDTLYRLHGTNEPESIGKAVSSGCVRLVNHDVIDLYDRVRSNAPIVVT